MSSGKSQLTLYRGFDDAGEYVWSPFVTKVEARLRFANLKYKSASGSVQKSPKGKIPYFSIQSPNSETSTISDSALIIKTLVDEGILEDLNARLSPVEKAHDLAIRALLEDRWYFYQACEKWHENYYTMRSHVLWKLPYPMQVIVGLLVYRNVSATLHGQGAARYTEEEINVFRAEIWDGIEGLLHKSKRQQDGGEKLFWVMGKEHPTEADTALFGAISASLVTTASPKSTKAIRCYPTVMEYARRIHDEYFPDFEIWP